MASLSVRYAIARTPALSDVSLEAAPGELVAVTGAHGAGKSTLAYALMGLVPHSFRAEVSGAVDVAGHDPLREGPAGVAGVVGLVLQNPYNQISGARDTVFDEVAFGLENLGLPPDEIEKRVREALERFGLAALAERNPFECSGGEAQRLAIASIWAMRPAILVLDEPTSQLDPAGAADVERAVEEARRDGAAVIVMEHRPEWLAARADRILVLRAGRALASGPPRRLYGAGGLSADDLPVPVYARLAAPAGGGPALTEDEALERIRAATTGRATSAGRAGPAEASPRHPKRTASPGEGPSVVIEYVRFGYRPGSPVIDGLSLKIGGPGVVGLIGRNGSGKSTLLRLLAGLVKPAAGRVRVAGLDTSGTTVAQVARRLAIAFQNPDDQLFLPTVAREAAYGARNLGRPAAEAAAAAERALAAVGIAHLKESHPYDLGFGQRKLVAVAAAVAMDTPILVLDEPTMAQDAPSLARLAELCRRLAASGRLVLLVSHHMEFVASVAGRVIVMANGRIVADGPPDAIFADGETLAGAGVAPTAASRLAARLGWPERPADEERFIRRVRDLVSGLEES